MIMTNFEKSNEEYVYKENKDYGEHPNYVVFYNFFKDLSKEYNEKRNKSHHEEILANFLENVLVDFSPNQNHIFDNFKKYLILLLEEESETFGLGDVYIEEKEYSDFVPVFVINVPKDMSFKKMDELWDRIIGNTREHINLSNDDDLIKFYNKTFITLRK